MLVTVNTNGGNNAARYRVMARPLEINTNFTEGVDAAQWEFNTNGGAPALSPALGSTGGGVRPGWLRMSVPNNQVYDCWNSRGACPFLLRQEALVGSYSVETLVEVSSLPTTIAGLAIYDAAGYSFNGYR